ncbi:hypothetical protein P4O66_001673 [Electrophorus voltai]|uniref:Rad50/SbcC-type AAA domain-containing protein n=1 Tax=Electrophorus voltai TaxID=2609070 RepID=A0AAD8Z7V3_9TELE|nr:hypothetical protein P4O66_001673 [Electrophorus voltai]
MQVPSLLLERCGNAGDIGVIESITLKNFMSHLLLGPFQFGPNVNFIVGNNGSGKSAILTALIVGLGGKATTTNRGASLKSFVKYGESSAEVTVKLKNRGSDAYKGDIYRDSICIEQRITSDGCRTCKIKSKTGQIISTKKEELTAILDHFNIQVDNPVSILNQEMSKQFLHSKSEADKYKCLKDLRQLFLQKKEKYESLSLLDNMRQNLEDLKKMMVWCLVREKEWQVQQLKEQIEKEQSDISHEDELLLYQTKVTLAEKRLQDIQEKIGKVKEEEECLAEESRKMKEENKLKSKAQKIQEVVYFRAENKLKQLEKEQCLLQERIHKISNSNGRRNHEVEHTQQLKKTTALKKQLEKFESESTALNQEIKEKQQALFKGREEYDKLSMEEKNIQVSLESKLKRKNQLQASTSNRLRRFGDHMPELLESVDRAHAQGRFIKKPVGPIGACINLKDPSLAVAVESCLRSFMKTFCCDNYKDEKVLQELMSQHFPKGSRPQIIVCPFTDRVYNVQSRLVQTEVENHQAQLCRFQRHLSSVKQDIQSMEEKLRSVIIACKRNQESMTRVKASITELENIEESQEEDVSSLEEQVKAEAESSKFSRSLRILENKLKAHQDNIEAMKAEHDQKEEEKQDIEAKAREICPVPQRPERSAKSLDAEITHLRQKIRSQESSHGNQEQVIRSLSVRCKWYFINFLFKLHCCGSMMFDHNNETLSISVKPPGQENDNISDMRSLSGGERSFSTVCFILSLWEITESPFRCLDEFDVYMDMHNRRISLDLLLELSERQYLRQFIFITPQTTSSLPKSPHIKVHQLQDPERETEEEVLL